MKKKTKEITIVKTGEKKRIVEKKAVSGMNLEIWRKWIIFFLENEIPRKGDILICDRLRVHESQEMINLLSKSGIELRLLPFGSAPELSICDNSLFKDFKVDYSKKLNGRGTITREEKKKIIDEVWEEFSIERSLRDVYAAIALDARKRDHAVNLELEWKLPNIKGDRARIEQVLMNIISNALKYTPNGGTIGIFSGTSGDNVWVKIEDTGVGIPKEDLLRVFDRFYRVDKARSRESGGTGLGLSIAREIVTKHGGEITIDSVPGVGTTVTISLPIGGNAA